MRQQQCSICNAFRWQPMHLGAISQGGSCGVCILLQHASPRSLEVPQGTFYCKSRCGGRENKVDFPIASALAFLPGPRARLVATVRRLSACVSYINTAGVTESAFLARKFWIISQQREVWLILKRFICRLPQRILSQALPMLTHQ